MKLTNYYYILQQNKLTAYVVTCMIYSSRNISNIISMQYMLHARLYAKEIDRDMPLCALSERRRSHRMLIKSSTLEIRVSLEETATSLAESFSRRRKRRLLRRDMRREKSERWCGGGCDGCDGGGGGYPLAALAASALVAGGADRSGLSRVTLLPADSIRSLKRCHRTCQIYSLTLQYRMGSLQLRYS